MRINPIPGIIALGAIQAAVVAAQPIPEFAKGTLMTPSEFIAGEKGRELMFLRSGEAMMIDKPTYFKGSQFQGAKIKSNPETEKIMAQINKDVNVTVGRDDRVYNQLVILNKNIKNQKRPIYKADKKFSGYNYGRSRTNYLN